MIDGALRVVRARLDAHLREVFAVDADIVRLGALVRSGQGADPGGQGLSLVYLGFEPQSEPGAAGPLIGRVHAAITTERVAETEDALGLLGQALGWVAATPRLTASNTPDMPRGLARVDVAPAHLDIARQTAIWQAAGIGVVPALFLDLRVVALTPDGQVRDRAAPGG